MDAFISSSSQLIARQWVGRKIIFFGKMWLRLIGLITLAIFQVCSGMLKKLFTWYVINTGIQSKYTTYQVQENVLWKKNRCQIIFRINWWFFEITIWTYRKPVIVWNNEKCTLYYLLKFLDLYHSIELYFHISTQVWESL